MSDRKRDRADLDSSGEDRIFSRSKKVLRSPVAGKGGEVADAVRLNPRNMEETKLVLMEMRAQMEKNGKEMKEQMEKNKEDLRKDIEGIKDDFRIKERKWESEKRKLTNRINELVRKFEMAEKGKRKNNIVIKGLAVERGSEGKEIRDFLKEKLKVDVTVCATYEIGKEERRMIVASLENFEQKMEVMKRKKELRDTRIYIENDLTREERRIQNEILKIARDEKGKGRRVRVGYKRIVIDGEHY